MINDESKSNILTKNEEYSQELKSLLQKSLKINQKKSRYRLRGSTSS